MVKQSFVNPFVPVYRNNNFYTIFLLSNGSWGARLLVVYCPTETTNGLIVVWVEDLSRIKVIKVWISDQN